MPLTQDQKTYILENYCNVPTSIIAKHLQITSSEVGIYAQNNKLKKSKDAKRAGKELNKETANLIIQNYEYGDLDLLSNLTGIKKHAISEWARRHGLKRKIDVTRNGSLEPLISGTIESFYWLGFIAADGYIYKNGHLMVSQSEKDKNIIEKLASYLNTSIYRYTPKDGSGYKNRSSVTYRVNISDKIIGNKIRDMFNIQSNLSKTYTGISLDFITNQNQAAAFLCGFIDGDGSLTSNKTYMIQCHESWFNTFKQLILKLPNEIKNCYLKITHQPSKKNPYVLFSLRKSASDSIRKFAKENNLPCSKRKFSLCSGIYL